MSGYLDYFENMGVQSKRNGESPESLRQSSQDLATVLRRAQNGQGGSQEEPLRGHR